MSDPKCEIKVKSKESAKMDIKITDPEGLRIISSFLKDSEALGDWKYKRPTRTSKGIEYSAVNPGHTVLQLLEAPLEWFELPEVRTSRGIRDKLNAERGDPAVTCTVSRALCDEMLSWAGKIRFCATPVAFRVETIRGEALIYSKSADQFAEYDVKKHTVQMILLDSRLLCDALNIFEGCESMRMSFSTDRPLVFVASVNGAEMIAAVAPRLDQKMK